MRRKVMRTLAEASSTTPEEVDTLRVRNLLGGLNTSTQPEDIANTEFQVLTNVELRKGRLTRRFGWSQYGGTAPDSNKITGLFSIKRYSGLSDLLRFTKNSIYKYSAGSWVAITGPALTGGDFDFWTVVAVEDRIFASNGVQALFELNLTANTYAAAGNARGYKYYTVANRRICAANLTTGTALPIELATCGNRNYTEWNPATDISAYQNPMVDSEPDTSDEITGLVALKDNIIVLRERSIWLGEPQPIASTPFNLRKVISGTGCTSPPTVQKVGDDKIIWYDMATKAVYLFKLNVNGVELKEISLKVIDDLHADIQDPRYVFSAYNADEDEYEIGINPPGAPGTYKLWKYCLEYDAWINHEATNGFRNWYLYLPIMSGSIGSLGTTPISSLSGTIAGLSTTVSSKITKFVAVYPNIIAQEVPGYYRDNGTVNWWHIRSKDYDLEDSMQNVLSLYLDFKTPGWLYPQINFYADGNYYTPKKTWHNYTSGDLTKIYKHNVACNRFTWEILLVGVYDETFYLDGYILRRTKGGEY